MAKRAFFLLVLETKTFLSAFKSGLDELDMDVYWRSGHSDRFLLQIWCPERPFSRGYECACLVWSSLIFLALLRWFCWSFAFRMERNMRSLPFCTTQLKCWCLQLKDLWLSRRSVGDSAYVLMSPHCWSRNGWSYWLCFYMYSTAKSARLCHLSHLHLSCTSAKKAFLGQWVIACFVHPWRNQVGDHSELKSRDGVFGWKFIKDFRSSHIHKWKRFGPGFFWCITIFFKLFDVFACFNVLVLCYYFFFNFRIIIFVNRQCWLSGHNHLYTPRGHIIFYFL